MQAMNGCAICSISERQTINLTEKDQSAEAEHIDIDGAYNRLLSPAKTRLGRTGPHAVTSHPFFEDTDWVGLLSGRY